MATASSALAGGDASEPLSAATLRAAIMGDEIAHRGRLFEDDDAAAFADGYVFAIVDRMAAEGDWCDGAIAPHEVVARVFDGLPEDAERPAAAAAREILTGLAPCS